MKVILCSPSSPQVPSADVNGQGAEAALFIF
jgi:hypothetical protein